MPEPSLEVRSGHVGGLQTAASKYARRFDSLLFVAGFGCWWAWASVLLAPAASSPQLNSALTQIGFALMLTGVAVWGLLALLNPSTRIWLSPAFVLAVAVAGAALSGLIDLVGGNNALLAIGVGIPLAAVLALQSMTWGALSIRHCRRRIVILTAAAVAAGFGIASVIALMPVTAGIVTVTLLPFAAGLSAILCSALPAATRSEDGCNSDLRLVGRGVVGSTVLVSCAWGLGWTVTSTASTDPVAMAACSVVALVVAILASEHDIMRFSARLLGPASLVLALGLLVPFFGSLGGNISWTLLWAGFIPIEILSWSIASEAARTRGWSVARAVGLSRVVVWGPAVLASLLAYELGAGAYPLQIAACTAFVILIAMVGIASRRDSVVRVADAASGATDAMEQLAQGFGLTARELDVLHLLCKGRDVRSTATTLFISENTVKTHISAIYGKTGVHNRQDLLDLFESYTRGAA